MDARTSQACRNLRNPDDGTRCLLSALRLRNRRTALLTIPVRCLVAFLVFGCFGCRPVYDNVSPVTGRVTLDGAPLADAQVMFQPVAGRPSVGITDGSGGYELLYTIRVKGAQNGMHTVMVTTAQTRQDGTTGPERVPSTYNVKSTLEKEVRRGRNTIDLALVGSGSPASPAAGSGTR